MLETNSNLTKIGKDILAKEGKALIYRLETHNLEVKYDCVDYFYQWIHYTIRNELLNLFNAHFITSFFED